jgi:hypothetical protein
MIAYPRGVSISLLSLLGLFGADVERGPADVALGLLSLIAGSR